MLFMSNWPLIEATVSFYSIVSFFVVAGTVKPIPVSPVELVDYLLVKLFNPIQKHAPNLRSYTPARIWCG
ncbi:MAG: hypothetical protein COW51_00765, partial [Candidatus Moranbacteria bacterium CG17_big_fil_post_rev_8_21_14_2_50_44_12]